MIDEPVSDKNRLERGKAILQSAKSRVTIPFAVKVFVIPLIPFFKSSADLHFMIKFIFSSVDRGGSPGTALRGARGDYPRSLHKRSRSYPQARRSLCTGRRQTQHVGVVDPVGP